MALPITGLKQSDVTAHFKAVKVGDFTKLTECIANFDEDGADPNYYVPPPDRLSDFRGYDHPLPAAYVCRTPDASMPVPNEQVTAGDWVINNSSGGTIDLPSSDKTDGTNSIRLTHSAGNNDIYMSNTVGHFVAGRTYRFYMDEMLASTYPSTGDGSVELTFQKDSGNVDVYKKFTFKTSSSFSTLEFIYNCTAKSHLDLVVRPIDNSSQTGDGNILIDNFYISSPKDIAMRDNAASNYYEDNATTGWSPYNTSAGTFNSLLQSQSYSDYYLTWQFTDNAGTYSEYYLLSDALSLSSYETYTIQFKYRYSEDQSGASKVLKLQITDSTGQSPYDLATIALTGSTWTNFQLSGVDLSAHGSRLRLHMANPKYLDIMDFDNFEVLIDPCPTAPDAPTNLSSSNISTTTFTLSWSAPSSDGGSAITDYKVYKDGSYYGHTGNNNTSLGITGQSAGNTATWTVVAVNSIGDSPASSGLSVTMSSGATVSAFDTTQSGQGTAMDACNELANYQRYKTGSATGIVAGDVIYTDNPGTTPFVGGNLFYMVDFTSGKKSYKVDNSGNVSTVANCGGMCFVEGTIITLADRTQILIEDLMGDKELLSYTVKGFKDTNDVDKMHAWRSEKASIEILKTNAKISSICSKTATETVVINEGLLETTPTHNHFIKRNFEWRFIEARDIIIGDKLMDINENEVEVYNVEINTEEKKIYPLVLNGPHTFFANNIMTHNGKAVYGPTPPPPADVSEVYDSKIDGYGYFALKDYNKDDLIGIWITQDIDIAGRMLPKIKGFEQWFETKVLGRYTNHSSAPNTYYRVEGENVVLYSNGIKENDEITADYRWIEQITGYKIDITKFK